MSPYFNPRGTDSPEQGAPASCHPGDGPDTSVPLSSVNQRRKKKYYLHFQTFSGSLLLHTMFQSG